MVITTFLYLLLLYLEKKRYIRISNYARACIILTVIAHHYFGETLSLYLKSALFDKALHVFGTYAFTLFFFQIMMDQKLSTLYISRQQKFIHIVLLGVTIGTFFEILEFFLDKFLKPDIPYQAGLIDTNLDLISDIIGAIIAAIHISVGKIPF